MTTEMNEMRKGKVANQDPTKVSQILIRINPKDYERLKAAIYYDNIGSGEAATINGTVKKVLIKWSVKVLTDLKVIDEVNELIAHIGTTQLEVAESEPEQEKEDGDDLLEGI